MKRLFIALLLGAVALPALPAAAQHRGGGNWSEHQRADDNRANRGQAKRQQAQRKQVKRQQIRQRQLRHQQAVRQQQKVAAWKRYHMYDQDRPDPRYGSYQADRYYRSGSYYPQQRLSNNDRIYRGSNGRYYCRRNDGTTGLIIGALAGGLLGRTIAPSRSKTLGTILGGVGGAAIGRSIGRNGVHCD